LEEIDLGGRIILKQIFKFEWEAVKCIGVFQDGDNVIAFLDKVVNIRFHKRRGNVLTICENKFSLDSALHYSVHKYVIDFVGKVKWSASVV
jgi:hypothetical protein